MDRARRFGTAASALSRWSGRALPTWVAALPLSACHSSGSPTLSLFGAYFPGWLLFALAVVTLAVIARSVLTRRLAPGRIPYPLLTLSAIGIITAWLLLQLVGL